MEEDTYPRSDEPVRLIGVEQPEEFDEYPVEFYQNHNGMNMPVRARNATQVHTPENSIHYICSNKEFCSELKDQFSPLRFDIRPRMFGDIKSNDFHHGACCSVGECETPARGIEDSERNLNLCIFAGKRKQINGEFPDDCLTLPPKFHEYAKRTLESIKILPPAPGNELKMVFNKLSMDSGRSLIVDKSFALYHCGVLKNILDAENDIKQSSVYLESGADASNESIASVAFKEVDYDTMKHIFLILYNPGTYFSEIVSGIRILRGNRLQRILRAAHMLEFRNVRMIISSAFNAGILEVYKNIYGIYRSNLDAYVHYIRPRGQITPVRPLVHAEGEVWNEESNKQKSDELVEKFRNRTNMAAAYEMLGVRELFAVMCEFMPELTILFMTNLLDFESTIMDNQHAKKIYSIRVNDSMRVEDIFDLLNEVKPSYEVTVQIIKYLVSIIQKNPINRAMGMF